MVNYTYPFGFSGKLNQDSPALFALLSKILPEASVNKLSAAYHLSCDFHGLEEDRQKATSGASFNPRPARIAQILINDAAVNSVPAIYSALVSTSITPTTNLDSEVSDLHSLVKSHQLGEFSVTSFESESIYFAWLLDLLRHWHLGTQTKTYANLEQVEDDLQNKMKFFLDHKIKAKLELALTRAKKL